MRAADPLRPRPSQCDREAGTRDVRDEWRVRERRHLSLSSLPQYEGFPLHTRRVRVDLLHVACVGSIIS